MAGIGEMSAKVALRLDSGEQKDGKTVYRSSTLTNVNGSVGGKDLSDCVKAIASLIELTVERATLIQSSEIDLSE